MKENNKGTKEILRAVLSSLLVKVSNQESDTRYAAITKKITQKDVFRLFKETCRNLATLLPQNNEKLPLTIVTEKDVLSFKKNDIKLPIGLIVTSPPYPNAYEYWLYHKYRMWWLGYDPIFVKEKEIGARAHFFKKNGHNENDFCKQMTVIMKLFYEVLEQDGFLAIVIGRSLIHGKIIDNASTIKEIAHSYSLNLVVNLTRTIASSRKSFNPSHAKIKNENILVFQKC